MGSRAADVSGREGSRHPRSVRQNAQCDRQNRTLADRRCRRSRPSTKTAFADAKALEANDPGGRVMHFGVREHAMGAIVNGLVLSKRRAFGATFLTFSDYMRPAIRLAALMEIPVFHVFTHDSIGLGEDGPTHQPIEQLVALRAIPNIVVLRPADA